MLSVQTPLYCLSFFSNGGFGSAAAVLYFSTRTMGSGQMQPLRSSLQLAGLQIVNNNIVQKVRPQTNRLNATTNVSDLAGQTYFLIVMIAQLAV